MSKDIIYIDVEDDITAIIGKIKLSKEKIIALVPPKRVGVLQSAVNLRLLLRMATNNHKTLVLITNNQALVGLAASAQIPVAKNLQSKPELPEITALSVDDDEDIIDGSKLPIGELEKTADHVGEDSAAIVAAMNDIDIDGKPVVAEPGAHIKLNNKKPINKVPNFNTFRKKLFIGIAAAVLLVIFLIWANVFAPAAKVVITARTTPTSVNSTVTLGGTAATDVSKGVIQSQIQTLKKDVTIEFDATGTKNVGEKAVGTVRLSQQSLSSITVVAGTKLTALSGLSYITNVATIVPASTFGSPGCFPTACAGTATTAVTAAGGGTDFNGETGSLSGAPSGVSATFITSPTGGTDKTATVVTQEDIQKASQLLVEQSSDLAKAELIKLFINGQVVIDDSFIIDRAAATSVPAVDTEATAKAKLTSTTTYTITALAPPDIELFIRADLEKQISGKDNQKIYGTGIDKVRLMGYVKTDTAQTTRIVTDGQIGPNIDEAKIKEQVKGKIFGDVQQSLSAINGIDDVDVQFSFFWVRTIPNDTSKITIEFKLNNE